MFPNVFFHNHVSFLISTVASSSSSIARSRSPAVSSPAASIPRPADEECVYDKIHERLQEIEKDMAQQIKDLGKNLFQK